MAVTEPRFQVDEGEIIDTKTREIIPIERFNKISSPAEKDDVERQLKSGGFLTDAPTESPETPAAKSVPAQSSTQVEKPSLQQFIEMAGPQNPKVPRAQLAQYWNEKYGHLDPATLPSLETFLPAAKEKNPNVPDHELARYWRDQYGILGAPEQNPPKKGFFESMASGAKQGAYALGSEAASTTERLQSPDSQWHEKTAAIADQLSKEAQKFGPSSEIAKQPWYQRLSNPEYLGNLIGNVAVQTAPSLAAFAGGTMAGGPAVGTAAMLATIYFQTAGDTYREAFDKYKQDGLSVPEAHQKAYNVSGLAGLVSGVVNGLAIPASMVEPFKKKLTNLALQYALNVGVDTADQITQNVVAKGTYAPERELSEGVPEAVVGSGLLSAPETMVAVKSVATGPAKATVPQPQATPQPSNQPAQQPAPTGPVPLAKVPEAIGVTDGSGIDQAIAKAFQMVAGPSPKAKQLAEQMAAELSITGGERLPTQDEAARLTQTLPRVGEPTPILEGAQPTAAPAIQVVTPPRLRTEPEPNPRDTLAQERQRLLAMRAQAQAKPQQPIQPLQPIAPDEEPTRLRSAFEKAYPSIQVVKQIAESKGLQTQKNPVFNAYVQQLTGKPSIEDLSPAELQKLAQSLERIKPNELPAAATQLETQTPTPAQPEPTVQRSLLAAAGNTPQVTAPRSDLPAEQNTEMLLRAEKAKADLEIAGKERGSRTFMEQQGQGSTQEVRGLKSPTAQWYKELTSGASPIKGNQKESALQKIETAINKIIEDEGSDRGAAVEKVKQALLSDQEFLQTPWGKDFQSILEGEWPSWVPKPEQPSQPEAPSLGNLSAALPSNAGQNVIPEAGAANVNPVDLEAHEAATSPVNELPEPTKGQKEAGNYKKGHVRIAGLDISIENPAGSERAGTDKNGKPWSVTMQHHYGYIRGTIGKDKDHIDVFIKPGTPENYNGSVFVVDQKEPTTGAFDEHKVVLGAKTEAEARAIYLSNYGKDWEGLRSIKRFTMPEFKVWLKTGNKQKPASKTRIDQFLEDQGLPTDVPGYDQDGNFSPAKYARDIKTKKFKDYAQTEEGNAVESEQPERRLGEPAPNPADEAYLKGLSDEELNRELKRREAAEDKAMESGAERDDEGDAAFRARAEASNRLDQKPLSEEEINDALYRATHGFQNADQRWSSREEKGLTDAELREALAHEFGSHGGSSGPGQRSIMFKGGSNPVLEIEKGLPIGKVIKGKELLDLARKVLNIPNPGQQSQKLPSLRELYDAGLAGKQSPIPGELRTPEEREAYMAGLEGKMFPAHLRTEPQQEPKKPTKAAMIPTRGGMMVQPLDDEGNPVGQPHKAGEKPQEPESKKYTKEEQLKPWGVTSYADLIGRQAQPKKGSGIPDSYTGTISHVQEHEGRLRVSIGGRGPHWYLDEMEPREAKNPEPAEAVDQNRDYLKEHATKVSNLKKEYSEALGKHKNVLRWASHLGKGEFLKLLKPEVVELIQEKLRTTPEGLWKFMQANKNIKEPSFYEPRSYEKPAPPPKPEQPVSVPEPTTEKAKPDIVEASKKLAHGIVQALDHGTIITHTNLFEGADRVFGGTRAEGAYTDKDAYDALELGVNQFLMDQDIRPTGSVDDAQRTVDWIRERILDKIPVQKAARTEEQNEFQQFSTPPDLSYVMNWAANLSSKDYVLEPSAGLGGLAAFAQNAKAKVAVNELSTRRASLLSGLFDQMFSENAEQIHNILPAHVKPTVVVMNPPFSSTAGRMQGQRKSANVIAHLDQALKRLQPGGRLVALIGKGKFKEAQVIEDWKKLTAQKYAYRANIGISGKGYKKYGTTYDNQILIYDKIAPTGQAPVIGNVEDVRDAIPLLKEVRDARQPVSPTQAAQSGTAEPRSEAVAPGGEAAGTGKPATPSAAHVVGAERGQSTLAQRPGETPTGAATTTPARTPGQREPVERVPASQAGSLQGSAGREPESANLTERPGSEGRGLESSGRPEHGNERHPSSERELPERLAVEAQTEEAPTEQEADRDNSVFDTYHPKRIKVAGAKKHPGKLVESAAMAAVDPPPATYHPALPKSVIESGKVSIAQLESTVYAGQAHEQLLPGGERKGFFVGDGTGVGKGREVASVILDNFMQGRKKAIWVSKNDDLMSSASRDWSDIGGKTEMMFDHGKVKATGSIERKDGILFTTYNKLASGLEVTPVGAVKQKEGKSSRMQQIVDWVGKDFDGVIAFDEAHEMRNNVSMKGARGATKPAVKALAGVELQRLLPKARIVYFSATGGIEPSDFGYAERLGMWGAGTPFPNKREFAAEVQKGGIATMEVFAQELKANGLYVARSLSYDDVTYDRAVHALTPQQKTVYDELAKAWQIVYANIQEALKATGAESNGTAKGQARGKFYSAEQRFFSQVLTSMQMPTVLERMRKDLDEGHAVVVQLYNTNEAQQTRELERIEQEGGDLSEVDLSPKKMLLEYLDKAFPTQQFEEYIDDDGNTRSRPVFDSEGRPVQNAEAVAAKQDLLERFGAPGFLVPEGALEQIINTFGPESVAEVTGRSERVVRIKNDDGTVEDVKQKRPPSAPMKEANEFMGDKRKMLVFSNAGSTGQSYHADLTKKNQRRRMHYVVQPGWQADIAMQGLGRTHRTNQASAPHYVLVSTDLNGHKRFISTIARRLAQLGALTRGQRQTSQGLFSEKDNLENGYSRGALRQLIIDLKRGPVEGFSWDDVTNKLGFDRILDKNGAINESALPSVPQFLNRILALEYEPQNRMFDAFSERMERAIEIAKTNGDLETGLENYKAAEVKLKDEKVVNEDPQTKAQTKLLTFDTKHAVNFRDFDAIRKMNKFHGFYRGTKTGKIYGAFTGYQHTDEHGNVEEQVRINEPDASKSRFITTKNFQENYTRIDPGEAKAQWQKAIDDSPHFREETINLLSGSLLRIWDRLPKKNVRVLRVTDDNGKRYVGRLLAPEDVAPTMDRLGIASERPTYTGEQIADVLENGGRVDLVNGWKLWNRLVDGEHRMELTGDDLIGFRNELKDYGVQVESRNFRTRFFVPTNRAAEILDKITSNRPVLKVHRNKTGEEGSVAERPAPYGQQEIAVPPPTMGEKPIIAREATPEEAPLFSKSAQEPEAEQGTLFEPQAAYSPTFYSQVAKTIEQKMPNRASGEQIRGILSPNNGVKPDELKWIGMDDYLKTKDYFTKEDVLNFVRQNNVQVQEVMKGNLRDKSKEVNTAYNYFIDQASQYFGIQANSIADEIMARREDSYSTISYASRSMGLGGEKNVPESIYRAGATLWNTTADSFKQGGEAKFSSYTLPGGSDYRELLLTLPDTNEPMEYPKPLTELPEGWHTSSDRTETPDRRYSVIPAGQIHGRPYDGRRYPTPEAAIQAALEQLNQERNVKYADEWRARNQGKQFTSSHFSEPNILAHVRFNDRTTATMRRTGENEMTYTPGKKVLFLEEVQSDWHQKGKKQGYTGETPKSDAMGNSYNLVPNAPFKKTWHELALKRMLRYAAENGYDELAWTRGEQQAERYDLSKHIAEIDATKMSAPGGSPLVLLQFTAHGSRNLQPLNTRFDSLPDYVGKDLAEKITADLKDAKPGTSKTYSGLDLKVGGEGMKGFYDKILPDFLNKYGKKWGAKVEPLKMDFGTKRLNDQDEVQNKPVNGEVYEKNRKKHFAWDDLGWTFFYNTEGYLAAAPITGYRKVDTQAEMLVDDFEIRLSARQRQRIEGALASDPGVVSDTFVPEKSPSISGTVHSFPITEAMKRSVLTEGQALFENGAKYEVRPGEQAKLDYDIARGALGDLDRAGQGVSDTNGNLSRSAPAQEGVKTVGVGISPDLIEKGVISLQGYQVTSPADLAKLAQVYRDPRFETFRLFYMQGDQIVGHEGISSRLPGLVRVFVGRDGKPIDANSWILDVRAKMEEFGADGYWLLHNHPSGRSAPSREDIAVTANIAAHLPGFKGHVVIDSHEYSHIGLSQYDALYTETKRLDTSATEKIMQPSKPHPLLGAPIISYMDVVGLAHRLKTPQDYVTILYRAANGNTRAIQEMPLAFFKSDEARTYLKEQAVNFGAPQILTYHPSATPLEGVTALVRDGVLFDHVYGGAVADSLRQRGITTREGMVLGEKYDDRAAEWVADETAPYGITYEELNSPEFPGIVGQGAQSAPSYVLPPIDPLDNVIRTMQDKFIDIRRLVDAIKSAGRTVSDDLNPVLKEEMYMGRTAQSTKDFLTDELQPLVNAMTLNKVSQSKLDEYLHARHAKEANAYLKSINPDLEDNESLSGMSDEKAEQILANADRPKMDRLAARVDSILAKTRDMMVAYGLESEARVESWRKQYDFYVPLHREGMEEGLGTGQGRSIRGSSVKHRTGSKKGVTNILANVARDREKVIVRGEKMRPVIALAGLLMQNPNKDIAALAKPTPITYHDPETGLPMQAPGDIGPYRVPTIKTLNKNTGLVEYRPDPLYKGRDNVVNFRIEGQDYAIVFNENNDRALLMAKALKDLDVGHLNTIMQAVAPVTRYLASVNTQYNPIFGVVNFVRDVQFAMLALSSTPLAGKRSEVWASTWKSLRGIYQDARAIRQGNHPTSQVSQLWERFQKVGGPTGYRDLFRTSDDRANAIEHMLDPSWWQKTMGGKILTAGGVLSNAESAVLEKAAKPLLDWLSDYNLTMENAVRLGVFETGLKQGLSEENAASLAKNITVNFNKKGNITTQMGAMFAFFNASVQGTARLAETLFEPGKIGQLSHTGKRIVQGGLMIGALQAVSLALAGFDDDEPPEWLKARSLVIPVPGTQKGYASIPMPLGFNLIPSIGRLAAETLIYGRPGARGYKFLSALMDTLSPVGGAASVTQFLAPTVVDPIVALSENKDWTGKSIYREDFNSLHPTPGTTRAKGAATPWARGLAEAINYATGGTSYTPGKFSPTPDQIDYLIAQATGGIGREVSRGTQVLSALTTGEEIPVSKIPGVSRFAGTASDTAAVRERFYRNLQTLNTEGEEIKGRHLNQEDVGGYLREHPEARLFQSAGHLEREIQDLNRRKRQMIEKGITGERISVIDQQIMSKMRLLNDRVEQLTQ